MRRRLCTGGHVVKRALLLVWGLQQVGGDRCTAALFAEEP